MEFRYWRQEPGTVGRKKPSERVGVLESNVATGSIRVCCDNIIVPRLAEIRDESSETCFFATVWRCPTCGKATQ